VRRDPGPVVVGQVRTDREVGEQAVQHPRSGRRGQLVPVIGAYAALTGVAAGLLLGSGLGVLAGRSQA